MKIKQQADCQVAIRRFDNGENIVFNKDTTIDVDEATGNYLLSMKCKDIDDVLQTDFIKVD